MWPLLLMTTPPLVLADRSIAVSMELVTAPVSGVSVVLLAEMVPALLMSFRLPPSSTMASDTRLKGEVELAMLTVGETVLVATLALMLAFLPTVISGTWELTPRITPKALPWPRPDTPALMVPGVLPEEFSASDMTSRRGTLAKAPI